MSSDAADGAQPPKSPASEPAAAAEASAPPAGAAPGEAAAAEPAVAGTSAVTGPEAGGIAAVPVTAVPGAVVPGAVVADVVVADVVVPDTVAGATAPAEAPSPELAAADAKAMTIVLDPEPDFDQPYADEPESRAQPVSKLAVLALVTGVLGLVPLAVGCGIGALIGIRRTGRRGHAMAMAALFAAAAWIIVAAAIGTVGALTHGFHKPLTIKYREAAVFTLQVGDCVNSPNGQLVSVLPCSTPHEAEVFATFSLPGSAWPGTSAVAQEASSGCVSRLTGYLNPQLAVSLAQAYVYPNRVAWTAGTHTVICEVRATSGLLTGSVRGAT